MIENVDSSKKNQETSMGQSWERHRNDLKNSVGTLACSSLRGWPSRWERGGEVDGGGVVSLKKRPSPPRP